MPRLPAAAKFRATFGIQWMAISFALLALAAGAGVAVAVQQLGMLALLLIPAIGLFIVSVIYPEIGLAALFLISVTQFSNILIRFHGLPSIAQPLAGLLVVVLLIRLFVFGERAEGWSAAALRLLVYGFVLFLTVIAAKSFLPASQEFQDYLKDALGAMIIVLLVQKPGRFKTAIYAIILAGLVMSSISVFQRLTDTFSNNYWGFGGWVTEVAGQSTSQRITGPYANPNAFSQVLIVVVVLALDRLWHERKILLRGLAGLAVVTCGMAIVFSYSRGGLLALIFALALLFVQRRPTILPLVLTAGIAILVLNSLPAAYTDRIATLTELLPTTNGPITTQSYRGRLSENMASWLMFRDNPILGVGIKNFPVQYQQYSRKLGLDPRSQARSPASLYGELIAEQGMLGTFTFFFLLWTVHLGLRHAIRRMNDAQLPESAQMANALWVALAGYLFAAITKNSAYSNVFWLLIGLAMAAANIAASSRRAHQDAQDVELAKQGRLA